MNAPVARACVARKGGVHDIRVLGVRVDESRGERASESGCSPLGAEQVEDSAEQIAGDPFTAELGEQSNDQNLWMALGGVT